MSDGARPSQRVSRERELRNQSSMRYWWPRLEDVDVPTPETICVEASEQKIELGKLPNGEMDHLTCYYPDDMDDIRDSVRKLGGPPAFIRTDQASHKHNMEEGSRIDSLENVDSNVWSVVEHNKMAGLGGLPYDRFYVREWLDLEHYYTAFRGTPIAVELRFFLYEGDVHSCGFYWPEDSIRRPSIDDWQEKHLWLRDSAFAKGTHYAAQTYAEKVADEFSEGYWSVDFALTEEEEWYCIDMARGEVSWHPEECDKPEAIKR